MLKTLFRVRLVALQSVMTGSIRTKQAQSRGKLIGFTCLMLFSLFALGFMFWHIFDTIAVPFHMIGLDWLYFSMAATFGFALMFIGSVFTAKAQLYEARDNDLLLSLPIKPSHILLSRLFMLWMISLVLELLAAVPAALVWSHAAGFSGAGICWFVLIFILLLPLLALAVSALFGWLLNVFSSRAKNKTLVTVLASLVFLGLYMYFMSNTNALITELAQNPNGAANALGAVALLQWIGLACAAGDSLAALKTAAVIIVIFAAAYVILEKTFIKTATDRRGSAKKKYVARGSKVNSPRAALFDRELKRFLSSPAYLLNCGLGIFFAPIGAVVLVIKRGDIISIPGYEALIPMFQLIFAAALCFFASTIYVTAPSVSLEGRSIWIAQCLPVSTKELLSAKLRLHNTVSIPPVLLSAVVVAAVMKPSGFMLFAMLALPALVCVFVGLLGLFENLRHPNFSWTNETQAVKSGVSVMLTMLISWGILALGVIGYIFLSDSVSFTIYSGIAMLCLAAACYILYRWIMGRGAERFCEL